MAVADEVVSFRAICVVCGRPASHTQRLVDGRPARVGRADHSGGRGRPLRGAVSQLPSGAARARLTCADGSGAPRNAPKRRPNPPNSEKRAHEVPMVWLGAQPEEEVRQRIRRCTLSVSASARWKRRPR